MKDEKENVLEQLLRELVESSRPQREAAAAAKAAEEAKSAKLLRARRQIQEDQAELVAKRKAQQAKCKHLRGNGTSCIAWAVQSDGVTRGVCMHCDRLIVPADKDYQQLRSVPVMAEHVIGGGSW